MKDSMRTRKASPSRGAWVSSRRNHSTRRPATSNASVYSRPAHDISKTFSGGSSGLPPPPPLPAPLMPSSPAPYVTSSALAVDAARVGLETFRPSTAPGPQTRVRDFDTRPMAKTLRDTDGQGRSRSRRHHGEHSNSRIRSHSIDASKYKRTDIINSPHYRRPSRRRRAEADSIGRNHFGDDVVDAFDHVKELVKAPNDQYVEDVNKYFHDWDGRRTARLNMEAHEKYKLASRSRSRSHSQSSGDRGGSHSRTRHHRREHSSGGMDRLERHAARYGYASSGEESRGRSSTRTRTRTAAGGDGGSGSGSKGFFNKIMGELDTFQENLAKRSGGAHKPTTSRPIISAPIHAAPMADVPTYRPAVSSPRPIQLDGNEDGQTVWGDFIHPPDQNDYGALPTPPMRPPNAISRTLPQPSRLDRVLAPLGLRERADSDITFGCRGDISPTSAGGSFQDLPPPPPVPSLPRTIASDYGTPTPAPLRTFSTRTIVPSGASALPTAAAAPAASPSVAAMTDWDWEGSQPGGPGFDGLGIANIMSPTPSVLMSPRTTNSAAYNTVEYTPARAGWSRGSRR